MEKGTWKKGRIYFLVEKLGFLRHLVLQEDDIRPLTEQIQQLHFTRPVRSLVDALFGTGLARNIEGRFAEIIRFMNTLAGDLHRPRCPWTFPPD